MGLHNKSVSLYDFVVVRDWIPRFNDLSRAKVDKVEEDDMTSATTLATTTQALSILSCIYIS